MASRNLEQGIQSVQQGDMATAKRLLKIALKNDNLSNPERVQALLWLAETDPDPKFKVEQYQQAIQLDPSNQDIINRLSYWMQQAQNPQLNISPTQNTPSQGINTVSPNQGQNFGQQFNQQPNWNQQPNTPSQGINPVNPNQGQNFGQQFNQQPSWNQQPNTPSQGINPVNPNQGQNFGQQFNQQPNWNQQPNTPSQGINPVNPNQGQNFGQQFNQQQWQQGNTPSQNMNPANPNQGQNFGQQQWQQGNTPSQQMPTVNPNQGQNFGQPNWNQQGNTPSQQMPIVNPNQGVNLPGTGALNAQAGFSNQPTVHLQTVQRSVGILGGPNGDGTGFFVTRDGLIATTRSVVSGERVISVELLDKRRLEGTVVRAFPSLDLAFVQVNVQVDHLLGVSQAPVIPDDMLIVAVTHTGEGLRSTKRRTNNHLQSHWFPTLINRLKDAGGNPVFDANNMLVGMLTNNTQRSNGYHFGLHIDKIYQCVNHYVHEVGQVQGQNTIYCSACGVISRAPSFNGFFCEHCGNTHPYALEMTRFPQPNLSQLYGETSPRACPNCASQAGFYDRECLRCGYKL